MDDLDDARGESKALEGLGDQHPARCSSSRHGCHPGAMVTPFSRLDFGAGFDYEHASMSGTQSRLERGRRTVECITFGSVRDAASQ
jgi:hypothetical protein